MLLLFVVTNILYTPTYLPSIMKCPKCGTEETIKAGSKITSEGKKQRYQCKLCGHTFTEETQ